MFKMVSLLHELIGGQGLLLVSQSSPDGSIDHDIPFSSLVREEFVCLTSLCASLQ